MTNATNSGADLPAGVKQAIAVSNATSIGEQPAILANLALANQIFNNNLAQQQAIAAQQAMATLQLATVAKSVEILLGIDPADAQALERMKSTLDLFKSQWAALVSAPEGRVMASESTQGQGGSAAAAPATGDSSAPGSNLPGEITEGIAVGNLHAVADQPAILANISLANLIQNTNQAQENAVSFQQTLNSIQATVLGKVVNMLTTLGPLDAMSAQQILKGNSVAKDPKATEAEHKG